MVAVAQCHLQVPAAGMAGCEKSAKYTTKQSVILSNSQRRPRVRQVTRAVSDQVGFADMQNPLAACAALQGCRFTMTLACSENAHGVCRLELQILVL